MIIKKQIERLRLAGLTYREIGIKLGVSHQRIHQKLKDYKPTDTGLTRQIKLRDLNRCLICDSQEKLEVHHIDGVKINNRPENLATVCRKCHERIESIDNKPYDRLPKQFFVKLCPVCKNTFSTGRLEQVYCSVECVNKKPHKYESKKEMWRIRASNYYHEHKDETWFKQKGKKSNKKYRELNKKMINKKEAIRFGKIGAEKRWSTKRLKKQELLEELRKHVDSQLYPKMVNWSVENLQKLVETYNKQSNGK